jgi:hypothetical protein
MLLCALAAALIVAPGPAHADGDPASDVLLGQSVFYPYQPQVSGSLQTQLNAETGAAAKAHFPIRVALIESPVDLGVITQLFGKPQQYAKFLDQEISYPAPQPLLVVMAAGFGAAGLPPKAQAAVASLRPPAGKDSESLAQAALTAVGTLAKADGHPLAVRGAAGGSGTTTYIVIALAAAALATAATLLTVRRRAGNRRRVRR